MRKELIVSLGLIIASDIAGQDAFFELKKVLPKELTEISGIVRDGNFLWAVGDDKGQPVYKLDKEGNILQKIKLSDQPLIDVEAISVDNTYLYIGDLGDNMGKRKQRAVVRVLKSAIPNGRNVSVRGERIRFSFPGHGEVKKQKKNNYDCEAMLCYNDSIYLFTKRRKDLKTSLYVIAKTPGSYNARFISNFKANGLVTDASANEKTDEIALIGYDEGHTRPFVWVLSNYRFDDFFSGDFERLELTNNEKLDWQIEGISYRDNNSFYLVCEKTEDVPNSIYVIKRSNLLKSATAQ